MKKLIRYLLCLILITNMVSTSVLAQGPYATGTVNKTVATVKPAPLEGDEGGTDGTTIKARILWSNEWKDGVDYSANRPVDAVLSTITLYKHIRNDSNELIPLTDPIHPFNYKPEASSAGVIEFNIDSTTDSESGKPIVFVLAVNESALNELCGYKNGGLTNGIIESPYTNQPALSLIFDHYVEPTGPVDPAEPSEPEEKTVTASAKVEWVDFEDKYNTRPENSLDYFKYIIVDSDNKPVETDADGNATEYDLPKNATMTNGVITLNAEIPNEEGYKAVIIPSSQIPGYEDPSSNFDGEIPEYKFTLKTTEVTVPVKWMDRRNNENSRPVDQERLSEYLDTFLVTGYDRNNNPIVNTASLPEDAVYKDVSSSDPSEFDDGKITFVMPAVYVDADGNEVQINYSVDQDPEKLADLGYYYDYNNGKFIEYQATEFTFTIHGFDGANKNDAGMYTEKQLKDLADRILIDNYALYQDAHHDEAHAEPFVWEKAIYVYDYTDISEGNVTVTIKALPYFRLESGGSASDPDSYKDCVYSLLANNGNDKIALDDDNNVHYAIEYDNTTVPNRGSDTDCIYSGGTIVLTLTGETEYRATKYWLDVDKANRPDATFTLWRYTDTKDGTKDYKTASPVRDSENNIMSLNIVGSEQDGYVNHIQIGDLLNPEIPDLPKYDAEGYEYIYFLRETMTMKPGYNYEQVLDVEAIDDENDGVYDRLENQTPFTRRDATDKSIYNNSGIANRISGTTEVSATKTWVASSYIDQLGDIKVEMGLFRRHAGDNDWEADPVKTETLTGFSSVNTTMTVSESVPMYDSTGNRYEYEWREIGVLEKVVKDDGTVEEINQLTEAPKESEADSIVKLTLNTEHEDVKDADGSNRKSIFIDPYDDGHITVIERQNYEYFESTTNGSNTKNVLVGKTDYVVRKVWTDKDGNPMEAPEGSEISFTITGSDGTNRVVTMNGTTVDSDYTSFATPTNTDTASYRRIDGWIAHIKDLPKYDADGGLIQYIAREGNFDTTRFTSIVSTDTIERVATVNNQEGSGLRIPVMKQWIDDTDTSCRYSSYVNLIYVEGNNETVVVPNIELSEKNAWYAIVDVPLGENATAAQMNPDNYIIRETYLKSPDQNGYEVRDNLSTTYNGTGVETVTTDRHMYVTEYATIEGIKTVINRRVGTVDVVVKKTWIDKGADKNSRPRETVTLHGGSNVKITNTTVDAEDVKSVSLNSNVLEVSKEYDYNKPFIVDDNGDNYTFAGLPKYDKEGKVINYNVTQAWIGVHGDYQASSSSNYVDTAVPTNPSTSGEEHDLLTVEIINKRVANEPVVFYKEWNDVYALQHGKRPDIYVQLYSTLGVNKSGEYVNGESTVITNLGFKTNEWSNDDRIGRNDPNYPRFWKITFETQPKYTNEGELITYYASELSSGDASQFDYQNTKFKDSNLEYKEIDSFVVDDETGEKIFDTWVEQATDNVIVLKQNGTFENFIKSDVKVIGKKIWAGIPEGYTGDLPKISIWLTNRTPGQSTFSPVTTDGEPVASDESNLAILRGMTTDSETGTLSFSFYKTRTDGSDQPEVFSVDEDGSAGTPEEVTDPTHFEIYLNKYNESGELFRYGFDEQILDDLNGYEKRTDDDIHLSDLFEFTTDDNLILTNTYPSKNYMGQIEITKNWDRPAGTVAKYPALTFKVYRIYKHESDSTKDTTTLVKEQTVPATYWETNSTFNFDNSTFPIYAPDGFKYIYYVEEIDTSNDGYISSYLKADDGTVVTGDVTEYKDDVTAGNPYKGEFTFKKGNNPLAEVKAGVSFKNTYVPEKTKVQGKKTWGDRNNIFGVRLDITDPQFTDPQSILNLKLYRIADNQPGQNNAITEQEVAGVTPTWTFENNNTWVFTYDNLDRIAPNGMPWKYYAKENISEEYAQNYTASSVSWTAVAGNDYNSSTVASMGSKENHLKTEVRLVKQWESKSYLLRPEATFELQVKIGDEGWKHARDVDQFRNVDVANVKTTDNKPMLAGWTFILKDESGTASTTQYTATWRNFPSYVKVDGNWETVKYRFVETSVKFGDVVQTIFGHAEGDNSCLADNPYPTYSSDMSGYYQPANTISNSKNNGYDRQQTKVDNTLVGGHVKLSVEKEWTKDNNNSYITRPGSIVFTIQSSTDGVNYTDCLDNNRDPMTVTLNQRNGWKAQVTQLPKYDEKHNPITYIAIEKEVPKMYKLASSVNSNESDVFKSVITNELEVVPLNGTKTWSTPEVINDVANGKVTLTLKRKPKNSTADGNTVVYAKNNGQPVWTLGANNVFSYSYEELPKYYVENNTLKEWQYYVVETPVAGYIPSYDTDKVNITNTVTKLMLNKVCAVHNTVELVSDDLELTVYDSTGKEIAVWTRSEAGNGVFEVKTTDPKVFVSDNGAVLNALPKGTYTVSETKTPAGYTKANDVSVTVNDSFTSVQTIRVDDPEDTRKTTIDVEKVWNDESDINRFRPELINVELVPYINGVKDTEGTVAETFKIQTLVALNKDNRWKYTFSDLPVYMCGEPITYEVVEVLMGDDGKLLYPDYIPSRPELSVTNYDDGKVKTMDYSFTNSMIFTTVKVTKIWDDNDDSHGQRPESITVKLVGKVGETVVDLGDNTTTVVLSKDNEWTYTFTNLPVTFNGEKIEYTVEEVCPIEYDVVVRRVVEEAVDPEESEPSLDVTDGVQVMAENPEEEVPEAVPSTPLVPAELSVESWEYELINTYPVTEVSVEKVWADNNNRKKLRPEEITVVLLADGEPTDGEHQVVEVIDPALIVDEPEIAPLAEAGEEPENPEEPVYLEVVLNEENEWKYTFTDLPKYKIVKFKTLDENGEEVVITRREEIVYTVEEIRVKGYTTKIRPAEEVEEGKFSFVITNKIIPDKPVPDTSTK